MKRLPRSNSIDPVVLSADLWDRIADEIERFANFTVDAPLHMEDTPAGRAITLIADFSQIVLVKVTGNASGGGKYNGRKWNQPTSAISASGNLAATDLGTDPGSDNVLVLNNEELGQSTHDLTSGTVKVQFFLGYLLDAVSDTGLPVVVINGIDWEACT